jgi:single-strand DNA-binding protein
MFDTNITLVGNVLTAPDWRRTANTNSLVAHFKVASTARRLDRETGQWIDGNSLRVRVNCWRRLAEGVASSVMVGDPVVVTGRLFTRDWTDADGNPRVTYELEAVAVGHDLARGRGRFVRNRQLVTSAVDDGEAGQHVRGEATEAVDEAPVRFGDGLPAGDFGFADVPALAPAGLDPVAEVRGGGFDDLDPLGTSDEPTGYDGSPDDAPDPLEPAPVPATVAADGVPAVASPDGPEGGRRPRRARTPVPA